MTEKCGSCNQATPAISAQVLGQDVSLCEPCVTMLAPFVDRKESLMPSECVDCVQAIKHMHLPQEAP